LTVTNQQPVLAISGTVGATLMIQSTTNPANPGSWNTITNLAITNVNAAATNQASNSTINMAFVPALQNYTVIDSNAPACEYYQVVMPYDYMVLADSVLCSQGSTNRLVLVRMPGISSDDVCYVTNQNSYLFYDATNQAFALEPSFRSRPSAKSPPPCQAGWAKTGPPPPSSPIPTASAPSWPPWWQPSPAGSDPVAGAAAPSIQIDF
jgi:hypothetical protein